jgi:hypothetical protein
LFYKKLGRLWRVSDCEELVVVITRDGVNVISGTKEKECNVMDTYIDT